jgi:hypothetical protein
MGYILYLAFGNTLIYNNKAFRLAVFLTVTIPYLQDIEVATRGNANTGY